MATSAQLDEKLRKEAESSAKLRAATPAQLAEKASRKHAESSSHAAFATEAQLAEKARSDQLGPSSLESYATPAQLAEKARFNQPGSSSFQGYATPAQLAEKTRGSGPPVLPPRTISTPAPPPYSDDDAKRNELISQQWRSHDPRSSSTHSLVPSETGRDGRRTLLLVWIHGFMGSELSFQSFPAHVHNLLTIALSETHLVHTKLYPRYKSRKDITFARDDFSNWLEPHENHYTDIILLGHSMGGLLSAEVVLQKPSSPATGKPFRHRILGTINFDTPFLGMHPGVVVSGLGSLFRPADPPVNPARSVGMSTPVANASAASSSYALSTVTSGESSYTSPGVTSPLASPSPSDPYFNPPFPNDVRLPERSGWSSLIHFVTKHSDGLTTATKEYFMSHLEFGGCMADYPGLKSRYEKIRALEDVDDRRSNNTLGYQPPVRRVRFVNYYTASTGRPKKPKIPDGFMIDKEGRIKPIEEEMKDLSADNTGTNSKTPTPRISIEAPEDTANTTENIETEGASAVKTQMESLGENSGVQDDFQEPPEMRHVDSIPMEEDEVLEGMSSEATGVEPEHELQPVPSEPALPPIPPSPTEPEPIDLTIYTDKDARKIAEKEHKRVVKAYQQAVKDRDSAIKDRKKLIEKREKKEKQEREKQLKLELKQRLKDEKEEMKQRWEEQREEEKRKATINPEGPRERQASVTSSMKDDKPKRDKKFCMLPPEYAGQRDKCWIRVFMEGVDEVGAHCGLFFQGPQYESLVGDVGARVEKWVKEDAARRNASNGER